MIDDGLDLADDQEEVIGHDRLQHDLVIRGEHDRESVGQVRQIEAYELLDHHVIGHSPGLQIRDDITLVALAAAEVALDQGVESIVRTDIQPPLFGGVECPLRVPAKG